LERRHSVQLNDQPGRHRIPYLKDARAEPDVRASHDVDGVALSIEVPADRLRREAPDAIDPAAAVDYARAFRASSRRACVLA
jgi:hypothetical protein